MIVFDFELNYFEEVETDIDDTKLWNYTQSPDTDLEERFANAIKEIIKKIQKTLLSIPPIFENIRIAHPKIFPYGVHLHIEEDIKQITIIAILHNKQDRSKLKKRL
jgi:hypothetical protein